MRTLAPRTRVRIRSVGGYTALLMLLTTAVACSGAAGPAPAGGTRDTGALTVIDANTSLLVVAPHPDDETLCCGGIIQRVLAAGGNVSVVWLTSGDASELSLLFVEGTALPTRAKSLDLGARRMDEARLATQRLGVARSGQLFLGYPDGGLSDLLQQQDRRMAYVSHFTGAAAVPYADAVAPGHAYLRANLVADFAAVLGRAHPTLVLAPSPRDTHPDHRAAGLLTQAAAADGASWQVGYWIVHGGEGWPEPRGLNPGVPLLPPPLAQRPAPVAFNLTPQEEDGKLRALRAHATQMSLMAPFLLAFVRTTELFSAR